MWQPPDAITQTGSFSSLGITVLSGAVVPALPATTPATCVPWNEKLRSSGRRPFSPAAGAAKLRATITFGEVKRNDVSPLGKPGGNAYPSGERNGFVTSMPSSTIATFIPSPVAPVSVWN